MAMTSACAVGSFAEVTRFQPRPTILPRRTTTAPNGPPSIAAHFFEREPDGLAHEFRFHRKSPAAIFRRATKISRFCNAFVEPAARHLREPVNRGKREIRRRRRPARRPVPRRAARCPSSTPAAARDTDCAALRRRDNASAATRSPTSSTPDSTSRLGSAICPQNSVSTT